MKLWTDIPGWFECEQGLILQKLCRNKIYLEVGSYKGRSTVCAADVATRVYAVDTFKAKEDGQEQAEEVTTLEEFKKNISGYDNIFYCLGTSVQAVDRFDDYSLDVILIDGMHHGVFVTADIKSWWPKLSMGGYMLFHDYAHGCQVKPIVDALFVAKKIISRNSMAWIKKENGCRKKSE